MIDVEQYTRDLQGSALSPSQLGMQADLTLNGAHSLPLRGVLAKGESGMWVTGDIGRKDHGVWNATQSLAEIGYSHGVSDRLQLGLSVGMTRARQDTARNGKVDTDGLYLMPEVIWNARGNLYVTVNGYYNHGEVETGRGYVNAGTQDYSRGETDATSWGGRLRADWLDAFHAFEAGFTPNISYTYVNSRVDAYTETGGGFPVAWNKQREESNVLRLGLDAVRPVSEAVNLLARVVGAYRFEDESNGASGQIIGLNAFSFGGRDHHQAWARAALGAEAAVGQGVAALMLNGSTAGDTPDYWLTAGYRVKF